MRFGVCFRQKWFKPSYLVTRLLAGGLFEFCLADRSWDSAWPQSFFTSLIISKPLLIPKPITAPFVFPIELFENI